MKIKTIATATDLQHEGFLKFKHSLEKFNWEYDIISNNYEAYGSKQLNAYNYAKTTDCTHLFILDAYDIIVVSPVEEILDKIEDKNCLLFNAEKAAWPYSEWALEYPSVKSDWKYLNGGACFVSVPLFIKMFEKFPIKNKDNDQEKLARIYLDNREEFNMKLDTDCNIFQSIAFEQEDDFTYLNKRLINKKTNTIPNIIHGNGKTDMTKVHNYVI